MSIKRGILLLSLFLGAACSLTACGSKSLQKSEPELAVVEEKTEDITEKNEYSGVGYRFSLDKHWIYQEKKRTELNFVYDEENENSIKPSLHTEVTFIFEDQTPDVVQRYYYNRKLYNEQGYEIQKSDLVVIDECYGYRTEFVNQDTGSALVHYYTIHEGTEYVFVLESSQEEQELFANVLDWMMTTVTWEPVVRAEVAEGTSGITVTEEEKAQWFQYSGSTFHLTYGNAWQMVYEDPFDKDLEYIGKIWYTIEYARVMDGVDEKIEVIRVDETKQNKYYDLEEEYNKCFLRMDPVSEKFYVVDVGNDITLGGNEAFWILSKMEDPRAIVYQLDYVTVVNGIKYVVRYEGDITDFEMVKPVAEAVFSTFHIK